jgi:hypothetical protein
LRGIGLERTGVLGIVGVCASLPKKLDPEGLFTVFALFAGPDEALFTVATRSGGFATAGVGAGVVEVVAGGATFDIVTGLSAFILEISFEIERLYGFDPPLFSSAIFR